MRRHRRRPSGPRRKLSWEYGGLFSDVEVTQNVDTVVSGWAKWPSASVDTSHVSVDFDYVTQKDQTLVRSVCEGYAYINAPSLDTYSLIVGVGLIAWESSEPEVLDRIVHDSFTSSPGPLSMPSLDWVHRFVVAGKVQGQVGFSTDLVMTTMDASDHSLSSRAQRKLPPGVGLLECVEVISAFGDFSDEITWQFNFSYRMLFKDP